MQNLTLPEQIETERLVLKQHTLDRAYVQQWVDLINQDLPWLQQFLPHYDGPVTFEKQKCFLTFLLSGKQERNYAIWEKDQKTGKATTLVGSIGAFDFKEKDGEKSAELGILLFKKFAGQGYGPEATKAFEEALFSAGLDSVLLKIDIENLRSRRAAEKQGHTWNQNEVIQPRPSLPFNKPILIYRKTKGNPHV